MSMGVCYVNMQNLKFRSWRGTEKTGRKTRTNSGTKTKENLFRSEKYFVKMSVGVCYVNVQNLKFRSWRGAEIDAVKVEASFSKNGLRQVKKFSFFLLFWLATSSKSRWNLDEISRRFRGDFTIDLFRSENFQVFQFAEKWLFPKLTFSLLKRWKMYKGSKNANFAIFDVFFVFVTKIKRKCSTIAMIFWGWVGGMGIRLPC